MMIARMAQRPLAQTVRAAVALTSLMASLPANASSLTGKVIEIHVRASDGLHWVILSGTPSARPVCTSSFLHYMIKDERSDAGKARFALLMSAHLSDRTITVNGAGTCVRWGDGEDIDHVMLGG